MDVFISFESLHLFVYYRDNYPKQLSVITYILVPPLFHPTHHHCSASMQILHSPSRNPLCNNNKDMIPHQLLIWEQPPDLNPGFCNGGQVLKRFSNKTVSNLPVNHSSYLWLWLWLSSCIIFYLHVCAELNYDSAPKLEALSILSFVRSACPPSTKTFYCRVITNINETLPVTISTIPHPLSPGLTPFALQIKERVYEPALAWQCWWGVITVERLSCSLHTLPLSSLGQKKKKMKAQGRSKTAVLRSCYHCSITVLFRVYAGRIFWTVAASVSSSDVKLWKTHFLLVPLYSCSLISFAITRATLWPSPYHYSQSCELRAAQQQASLFSFSKHLEQEQNCARLSSISEPW